jgi:hypothetical protein
LIDDDPKGVIEEAWAHLQRNKHHPNYVGIQIVQIGNSTQAAVKLKELMGGNIGVSHVVSTLFSQLLIFHSMVRAWSTLWTMMAHHLMETNFTASFLAVFSRVFVLCILGRHSEL